MLTPPDRKPPSSAAAGRHTTAIAAASAVRRSSPGRPGGQRVVTSLLRTGMYVVGWDVRRNRFGTSRRGNATGAEPDREQLRGVGAGSG
jgi:hypothetical protein